MQPIDKSYKHCDINEVIDATIGSTKTQIYRLLQQHFLSRLDVFLGLDS